MNVKRISTTLLLAVASALVLGLLTASLPAHAVIGRDTPTPAAPSNLTAKAVSATSVQLSWTNNDASQSGVVISRNGTESVDVPGTRVSTYTWNGLSPGTKYWFYVASKIYGTPGDPTGPGNTQSAWVGPVYATTAKSASPVKHYAALGDSYSAGLGTSPAYPNGVPNCGQSVKAYPALLDADVPSLGKLGFIACAGDVTDDFYTNGKNLSQLDALGLLSDVKTVTLTIGGNDIGFAPVITDCALHSQTDCYPRWKAKVNKWINALAGKGSATTIDGRPIHAMVTLLAHIYRAAPNARIFVAGYPRPFGVSTKYYTLLKGHGGPGTWECHLPSLTGKVTPIVRYNDAQWFDQTADTLNGALANAVKQARGLGMPVTFVSVRAAFTTHGDCDSGSSWLTPFNLLHRDTTLHPTAAGQRAYEKDFRAAGI
jgi:lysophospholipase L1-like esterase